MAIVDIPLWVLLLVLAAIALLLTALLALFDLTKGCGPTCTFVKRTVLPDICDGACPKISGGVAGTCVPATVKPYGPFGVFGTQAATCTCLQPGSKTQPMSGYAPPYIPPSE